MRKTAVVDQKICVACGACVKACPRGALTVWRGCHAVADAGRCVGCGLCQKNCPAGCIAVRERSGTA